MPDVVGHEPRHALPGRRPADPEAGVGDQLVGEEEARRPRRRRDAVECGAHAFEEPRLPVARPVERLHEQLEELVGELVVGGHQAAVDAAVVVEQVGLSEVGPPGDLGGIEGASALLQSVQQGEAQTSADVAVARASLLLRRRSHEHRGTR